MPGSLSVTCGPMFAGKSTRLYDDLFGKIPSKRRIFKPLTDTRGVDRIVLHDGRKLSAISLDVDGSMFPYIDDEVTSVFIDEVQFFDPWIVREIKKLIINGVHVYAYGLDLDYRGLSWPIVKELLPLADNVKKLKARCQICGEPASKTIRKQTVGLKDQVFVGAADSYEPRCNGHFFDDESLTN